MIQGRIAVVQKGSLFFSPFPIGIVKKVQTLTKLLSLQGKRKERKGNLGKDLNFSRFSLQAKSSFSSPPLPLLPRTLAIAVCVRQLGEWTWGEGL